MRCILLRHGQTDWNIGEKIQGQADIPLNELGKNQSAAVAVEFARLGVRVDAIISSDLIRAMETAAPFGRALGVNVITDPRLRECSFGVLEGYTPKQISEQRGIDLGIHRVITKYDLRPFGGESYDDVFTRHLSVIEDTYAQYPQGTVMFVGHGRGLITLLHGLGHIVLLNNVGYYEFEYNG